MYLDPYVDPYPYIDPYILKSLNTPKQKKKRKRGTSEGSRTPDHMMPMNVVFFKSHALYQLSYGSVALSYKSKYVFYLHIHPCDLILDKRGYAVFFFFSTTALSGIRLVLYCRMPTLQKPDRNRQLLSAKDPQILVQVSRGQRQRFGLTSSFLWRHRCACNFRQKH